MSKADHFTTPILSHRAALAGVASTVALPIAAAVPTTAPAMPAGESKAVASVARAEEIVSLLRERYTCDGWKIDDAGAELALAYCRAYAADGSDPGEERIAAFDFIASHGQSLGFSTVTIAH
jgi:hypothetical protein